MSKHRLQGLSEDIVSVNKKFNKNLDKINNRYFKPPEQRSLL